MSLTFSPNVTLSAVTLRNGVAMTANNHSVGTSFATYKGKLMAVLFAGAPAGDAAANFTANIYAHYNSTAGGGAAIANFTQVTNAAASIQRLEIDLRDRGNNVFLSSLVNVAGTNFTAPIALVIYGSNSANG
jgi:hypothetical protein